MKKRFEPIWLTASAFVLVGGTICYIIGANDPGFLLAAANRDSGGQSVVFIGPCLILCLFFLSVRRGIDTYALSIGLVLQCVGLILAFAGIYSAFGLLGFPAPVDRSTSLYFSVVTWTTLGYGDVQPSEEMRLVAAFQALLGYIYLGLIVGAVSAQVISSSSFEDKAAAED